MKNELYIPYSDKFTMPVYADENGKTIWKSKKCKSLFTSALNNKRLICYAGGRGTGKTTLIWFYIFERCATIPGFTVLVMRGETTSIDKSLISTLNKHILRYPLGDNRNPFKFRRTKDGVQIVFDNGSKIDFIGTKDPDKIKGFEPDLSFLNEATREKTSEIIDVIRGSQGEGRGGAWFVKGKPFSQTILDTNPHNRKNWVFRMFTDSTNEKKTEQLFETFTMLDNPHFSDDGKTLNRIGEGEYKAQYRAHQHDKTKLARNVFHEWMSSEGLVYPQFDPKKHIVELQRDQFGGDCKWHYSSDWGTFSATGIYVVDPNGFHYMFKEIYRKDETAQQIVARIKKMVEVYHIPSFQTGVSDHEKQPRRELQQAGFPCTPAKKVSKANQIQNLQWALANGKIKFNKYSLDDPDPELSGQINCATDEFQSLMLKDSDKFTGTDADDLPEKGQQDHGCDQTQYYCSTNISRETIDQFFF